MYRPSAAEAELPGRKAVLFLEGPVEMSSVPESTFETHFVDIEVGVDQEVFCVFKAFGGKPLSGRYAIRGLEVALKG